MSHDPDNQYDQDNPALEKDACNVFIKYLPPELTDTGLYALFAPFGEIESCKVMVDPITGHSLGYGFCRYLQPEYAEAAITKMTGQKIANKTLLCKLSNSSSANNAEPSDNLYIKPLLATTSTDELRMLFEKFGPIKECKVMVDKNTGMSRQLGFVRFQNKQDAIRALKETNGYVLQPNTPPIVVKFAESDRAKVQRRAKLLINQSAAAARQMAAYIYQMQQQQAMWSQAAYSMMPPSPGAESSQQSAMPYVLADSYGNVTIAPTSSEVPTSEPTTAPGDAPGSVSPASSTSPPPYGTPMSWEMPMWPAYGPAYPPRHRRGRRGPLTGTNLFVFHLPPSIDDQGLWRLFSPFGQLDSVKVICDRTMHKSKGYGFVKYIRLSDAMTAVAAMNGFPLENKHLKVTFKQHYLHMRRNRRRFDPSRYYHANFQGDQEQGEYEIGEGEEIDDEDVEEDDEEVGEDQQDEDEESEDNELETEEQQRYRSHGRGNHHYNNYHNGYHGNHRSYNHRRYRDHSHNNSPAQHERTYTAEDLKAQPYLAAVIGTRNTASTEQQTPATTGQNDTTASVSTENNTNQPQQPLGNPYPYNKHRKGQYNGQRNYQNGYKSHPSGHSNPYHYPAYTGKKTTKYRSHETAKTDTSEVDKLTTQVGQVSIADEGH
jgi:RNA recognition motif-containing protein